MSETILVVLLGVGAGLVTGLVPGLHVNTLLALFFTLPAQTQADFAFGVIALSITHSFVNFIPATLLGIPSEDKALAVLPGHFFAKKGMALHAIRLTIAGGLSALLFSVALTPFMGKLLEKTFNDFAPLTPVALAGILVFMIAREKTLEKKLLTLLVVALAGLSGAALLNNSLFQSNLFVLVTGFFTMPMLLIALSQKSALPKQNYAAKKIHSGKALKAGFLSSIASCFTVFLPAIGPNEAILASSEFSAKPSRTRYLLLTGGITTANYVTSIAALYFIGKTRTGTAVFVKQALPLTSETLFFAMAAAVTAGGLAGLATEIIAGHAVKKFEKTDYALLTRATLAFILALILLLAGPLGLIALLTATCIGLLAVSSKVNRSCCMAFLILPTILFYVNH
ncbi:MAG: tripartite tricarboxylate transporter permease [Candidatus Diapherotrites archaeon]|nr:tripartite tricarboxylate transporter permease [Candidatus Diapherotrites archaeon]